MNQEYYEEVLSFALNFGKKLLECGYEVMKTQDTMERLCRNFNVTETNFFVIPSKVEATIKFEEGNYISQMREITKSGTNLYLIENLNALSRKICQTKNITLDDAKKMFDEIKEKKPYNTIINSLGAGLGTGGFSVFFGGTLLDGLWAFIIGFLAFYIFEKLSKYFSKIAVSFMVSIVDGFIAILIYTFGLCDNLDMVMMGAIMTMIPGMSFGNSVKDLLIGNTISGLLTIVNAILISIAIAGGLAIPISLFIKDYVYSYNIITQQNWIVLISSIFGSLGFGLLFSLEPKKLPIVSVGGILTTAVYIISTELIPETSVYATMYANIIASVFALIMCEILARLLKAPTSIFLLPFIIPLVPGGSLYRTMIYMVNGDYATSSIFFQKAIQTGLGIAIGLVSFGILFRAIMHIERIIKQKIKI